MLIVDDNRDAADTLGILLQLRGMETRVAYDGASAITSAEQFRPHLIFMDLGLPNVSGYEATRAIRMQPCGRDILIVALSGWGATADRAGSRTAGADFHLLKPIAEDQLDAFLSAVRERLR